MPYYETVFMARQDLTDAQVTSLTEELCAIITDMGGKVTKTENWGLRNLAYRINKARKAHYVLLETDAPSEAVIELERKMRLNEDIMRSLTIRLDELTKGPSVMMEKPSRDEKPKHLDHNDKFKTREAA